MCFQVTREVTHNDVFHWFASDACQSNRAILGRVVSVSLIVEWGNIDMFPIIWHLTSASDFDKMHCRVGLMEALSRFSMIGPIPSGPHAL